MRSIAKEKKLSVHPWSKRVNLNFYADGTLTPRGKRRIDAKARELRQSLELQTV